jgi:hypothetical protein
MYLEAVYTNEILPRALTYEPGDMKRAICVNDNSSEDGSVHYRYPGQWYINRIYKGTPSAGNLARRFLVYIWLLRWNKSSMEKYKGSLQQEFLSEVLQETMVNGCPRKRKAPYNFVKMDKFMEDLGEKD